jgi:hypothetical protein
MSTNNEYLTICPRCAGTGRYDRGACFECKRYGALGFVWRATKRGRPCFVTAIRDPKEGRIPWVTIYGSATPAQAVALVQRVQRVAGLPAAIIESVQATA